MRFFGHVSRCRLIFVQLIAALYLSGCGAEAPISTAQATTEPKVTTVKATETPVVLVVKTIPATWTTEVESSILSPTPANRPSRTPRPTSTPWPTETLTPSATSTPMATLTPAPTFQATDTPFPFPTVPVVTGANLLPNPSFEQGWFNLNGTPELQVPNQWMLEWDIGENPLDPDPWNVFVRPESRVLNGDSLPAEEHSLFIWDGEYTVKIFKREGALSFRLLTDVYLEPGTYMLEINAFPDMIVGYTDDGEKIWAPDPLSAELQFIAGDNVSNWIFPIFGQRNTFNYTFQIGSAASYRLGMAFRGRWAILNNGWFMDDWSLYQLSSSP